MTVTGDTLTAKSYCVNVAMPTACQAIPRSALAGFCTLPAAQKVAGGRLIDSAPLMFCIRDKLNRNDAAL